MAVTDYAALHLSTIRDGIDQEATLARAARHDDALASVQPAPLPLRPAAWGAYVRDLIDLADYPNISGTEVLATHARVTRSGAKNTLPGPWGIRRLLYVLAYVQYLRTRTGSPLRLNSLYRNPAYNAAIGGASRSQHMACAAADLAPQSVSVAELHRIHRMAERVQGIRLDSTEGLRAALDKLAQDTGADEAFTGPAAGVACVPQTLRANSKGITLVGGIGLYRNFVHIDLRGSKSRWNG